MIKVLEPTNAYIQTKMIMITILVFVRMCMNGLILLWKNIIAIALKKNKSVIKTYRKTNTNKY